MKQTRKVAIGQLVMNGRGHLVGIKPHDKGLMLVILRYADEMRSAEPYFLVRALAVCLRSACAYFVAVAMFLATPLAVTG